MRLAPPSNDAWESDLGGARVEKNQEQNGSKWGHKTPSVTVRSRKLCPCCNVEPFVQSCFFLLTLPTKKRQRCKSQTLLLTWFLMPASPQSASSLPGSPRKAQPITPPRVAASILQEYHSHASRVCIWQSSKSYAGFNSILLLNGCELCPDLTAIIGSINNIMNFRSLWQKRDNKVMLSVTFREACPRWPSHLGNWNPAGAKSIGDYYWWHPLFLNKD